MVRLRILSYNKFMTYDNWLKFTENGEYHYWEVINNKLDESSSL